MDAYISQPVAKQFFDGKRLKWYTGTVVKRGKAMSPVKKGQPLETVWHVVYEDGDEEDLDVRLVAILMLIFVLSALFKAHNSFLTINRRASDNILTS